MLDQGRTLAEGTPAEIRANLDVAAAYLGESAVEDGEGRGGAPEPLLELEDLRRPVRAVAAVRGLSLEVGRGEIVGLIGPNGAGKSTTLHAIMGSFRSSAATCASTALARGRSPEAIAARGSRSSRRAGGSSPS